MSEEGRYVADGRNAPGGEGELTVANSRIDFDGAATMGADLLAPRTCSQARWRHAS